MGELLLSTGETVLFDDDDRAVVEASSWSRHPSPHSTYVRETGGTRRYLHRVLCADEIEALGGTVEVDHRNGDGLDNRRANLRVTTVTLNQANRRPHLGRRFKGATYHRRSGKWQAQLVSQGRNRYLGLHPTEEAAARCYDEAALAEWGEYARVNFPLETKGG